MRCFDVGISSGYTQVELAAKIGVIQSIVSAAERDERKLSAEMAVRLSKVFGGSAESWLTQQPLYHLSQVHADRIKLTRLQLV